MSTDVRCYDNEHGDPVVVMVTTGTSDVSRLVALLHSGRCEDGDTARKVLAGVKRHNGGRDALALLKRHGGPDFTDPSPAGEAPEHRVVDLMHALEESIRAARAARVARRSEDAS